MIDNQIAKIAISGAGMIGRPGIAAQMFRTLAKAGVNIQMISTSEVKVSCVIDQGQCDLASEVLCEAFEIASSTLPIINHGSNLWPGCFGFSHHQTNH